MRWSYAYLRRFHRHAKHTLAPTESQKNKLLEAIVCGVPIAAYPVTGPIDVVRNGVTGILDKDLKKAALAALELDPEACIDCAKNYSWQACAEAFLNYLAHIPEETGIVNHAA